MEERKSLKQLLIYHSPDGSLSGVAVALNLSSPTISAVCSGQPVGKATAILISEFVEGVYSVAELMGV